MKPESSEDSGGEDIISDREAIQTVIVREVYRDNPFHLANHDSNKCFMCLRNFGRETGIAMDGPKNSDIETVCNHWMCTDCWRHLANLGCTKCPFCHVDISRWINSRYEKLQEDICSCCGLLADNSDVYNTDSTISSDDSEKS